MVMLYQYVLFLGLEASKSENIGWYPVGKEADSFGEFRGGAPFDTKGFEKAESLSAFGNADYTNGTRGQTARAFG